MIHTPDDDRRFERLYAHHAVQLRRVMAAHLDAPEAVVEDACQTAWMAFLAHAGDVDERCLLGWLATTARREALRTLRRAAAERALVHGSPTYVEPPQADPVAVVEAVERLGQLARLPVRQQRVVWLQGLGFGRAEIASRTGISPRSVERQLAAARRSLRSVA